MSEAPYLCLILQAHIHLMRLPACIQYCSVLAYAADVFYGKFWIESPQSQNATNSDASFSSLDLATPATTRLSLSLTQ